MWISVQPIFHAAILEPVRLKTFVSSELALPAQTFAIAASQVVILLAQTSLERSSPKGQPRRLVFHPSSSVLLTGRLTTEPNRREVRDMTIPQPGRFRQRRDERVVQTHTFVTRRA